MPGITVRIGVANWRSQHAISILLKQDAFHKRGCGGSKRLRFIRFFDVKSELNLHFTFKIAALHPNFIVIEI